MHNDCNRQRTLKLIRSALISLLLVSLAACAQPDSPSNAAIRFLSALRAGDTDEAASLVCDDVRGERTPQQLAEVSWGPFSGILQTQDGAVGVDAEFTAQQELDLDTSASWVEYEFRTSEGVEATWRIQTIREDNDWRVCDAEQR